LQITDGGIDENVNPSSIFKLAEALIKPDKEFDILILPSQRNAILVFTTITSARSDGITLWSIYREQNRLWTKVSSVIHPSSVLALLTVSPHLSLY